MNKSIGKKLSSLVLTLMVMMSAVLFYAQPVLAGTIAEADFYMSKQEEHAVSGTESKFAFTLPVATEVSLCLTTNQTSMVSIALYDSTGALVSGEENPKQAAFGEYQPAEDGRYTLTYKWSLSAGDYTCGLTFGQDTTYEARIYGNLPEVSINKIKAVITSGYSTKLSVSGEKVKSWTSKNKSVATVDKQGKVTGKKAGKTTIVATLQDKRKLTCTVTVRKNEYTGIKGDLDQVESGSVVSLPYKAYFDSEGNLQIKVNILNKTDKRVIALTDLKITVTDQNHKTVGICKVDKRKVSVPANSTKVVRFTIRKSAVRRSADLRKADIGCKGNYQATIY